MGWRTFCLLLMSGWLGGCLLTTETIHYRRRPDVVQTDVDRMETDARSSDGSLRNDVMVLRNDGAVADASDVFSDDAFADRPETGDVAEDHWLADDAPPEIATDVPPDRPMHEDAGSDTVVDAADAADIADIVDVPVDTPPPPPILIRFRHSSDVMRFSDYWVRWEISGMAISAWETGHCVSGIRSLPLADNWTECELDRRLPPGTAFDFYPIYPGGGEVCGSGGPCPSMFLYRFVVIQDPVTYTGSGDISFQSETVGTRVYRYLRVYLR